MDNLNIWNSRMRNPEPLTQNQRNLINECPYLSRVRSFSEDIRFYEFYEKNIIIRSFTWGCDESCICLKPYIV